MNFPDIESLQSVANVVNEADLGLNDKTRTINDSPISDVLCVALSAGIGGAASYAAGYHLAAARGLVVKGTAAGAVAGAFIFAVPVAVLAGTVTHHIKAKQLEKEKISLYEEALKKHEAIIKALREELYATKERMDYLNSLNINLQQIIKDLQKDLGNAA